MKNLILHSQLVAVFLLAGAITQVEATPPPLSLIGEPWFDERPSSSRYGGQIDKGTYQYGDPTVAEQAHLERINRARSNPQAEANRLLGGNINEGIMDLSSQISVAPKQPLTFNSQLQQAARLHSQDMIAQNYFQHNSLDGRTPWDRISATGYIYNSAGENIYSQYSGTPLNEVDIVLGMHDGFVVDSGITGRGHRQNIFKETFKEIGIGVAPGSYIYNGVNYSNSLILTSDFGSQSGNSFILGVVYDDKNADGEYSAGEGLGGVSIIATRTSDQDTASTTTASAGGYGMPLPPGTYEVSATFPDGKIIKQTQTLVTSNIKIDFKKTSSSTTFNGADFNGDGMPDILWRNKSTGYNYVAYMNGSVPTSGEFLSTGAKPAWSIVGVDDFNGDGMPDILWRNILNGENYLWYMNGQTKTGGEYLQTISDTNWAITGVDDFNADNRPDIIWSNTATGQNRIWYMSGATKTRAEDLPPVADTNWKMAGIDDFNADGMPDILWRNRISGQNYVWYMNGPKRSGGSYIKAATDTNWAIAGLDDFNADNKPDIIWRNTVTGENVIWFMNGVTFSGRSAFPTEPNTNWEIVN